MSPEELKARTKKFGLRIIKLYEELSNTRKGEILGNQLLRAGTSVGTNYRAESNIVKKDRLDDLLKEANELIAIFTSSGRTVKQKRKSKPNLIGNNPKSEIRNSK